MLGREAASKTPRMKSLRKRLTGWRTRQGSKGRRIPERLWAEAVEIAAEEGVESTARLLQLDPVRLGGRVAEEKKRRDASSDGDRDGHKPELEFIEVELPKEERGWTIIKMVSSKGNELQIAGMASAVDIHGLVRDFWRHC
jgi:hypothetical protein